MRTEDTAHFRCLAATPDILTSLAGLAPPEQLVWKPAPDRWSVCEILGHLEDVEKLNVGLRVKRILEEEMPSFLDYDQQARYAAGAYRNDDGRRALHDFRETRRRSLVKLRGTSTSDWTRRGRHPAVGDVQMSQLMSLWAFHDLSHLRQIAELLKATLFWDGIGSLQVYYNVKP
ncbi:MAG TPA: DinB family protein [Vicinamibacteria bacterium]|nr:DinB family protein [Vicinamibacteria bacterium]